MPSIKFASALAASCAALALISGCASMTEPGAPQSASAAALGMPTASPESKGFSAAGLAAMNAEYHALVDQKKLAGITTLIARHGKVIHMDTYGKANVATGDELKSDSIFRIASMTKPVVGVAMMQLYEQGKWKLDDPVAKHIPEFANLQVKKAGGGTEPQKKPMTMAQLMSHQAGFGVSATYNSAGLQATNTQGMIDKLSKLPLETQPGTAWDYGPSVDIQGYLVEKLSGQTLDVYLDQHIFKPLGMVDTGFWVAPEKASRVVTVHTYDKDGNITAPTTNNVRTAKPSFLSGSGGLLSTAEDYWRFAQAVLDDGEGRSHKLLKTETVKVMRTSVLSPGSVVDLYGPSMDGIGFGMDFAIVLDPKAASTQQGKGSYYWGGAFGTWFWIDPTNDLVFIGMIQNQNGSTPGAGTPSLRPIAYRTAYAALTDPSK